MFFGVPYNYVFIYTHRNINFLLCFLLSLQGINGILADEMGLGKTVQSIALLAHLAEVREHQHNGFLSAHTSKKLYGIFNGLCCCYSPMKTSNVQHLDPIESPCF